MIIWATFPEPKGFHDWGITHKVIVDGKIIASIRESGWGSRIIRIEKDRKSVV